MDTHNILRTQVKRLRTMQKRALERGDMESAVVLSREIVQCVRAMNEVTRQSVPKRVSGRA